MEVAVIQKKETELVPKLRFSGFENRWISEKLGDLGNFIGGGTPSSSIQKYWSGTIPWISSSDIREETIHEIDITRFITKKAINESATKLINRGSVLIVSRVGIGKFAVSKKDLCTSQDFTNFSPTKDDPYFLSYYFKSKVNRFVNLAQGTSIKGFTGKDIKTLKFPIPSVKEQQKIASFLSAVDTKIQQLQRKKELLEQYKKGVMQQIFSREIRFKKDDGSEYPEWEIIALENVFERVKRKNSENNNNVLTISAQFGLINQQDFFNKSVSAKDVTGYYLLNNGEFAYNKSYSKGYPMGAIKRLNKYDKGVVSTLYICFKLKENNYSDFYEEFFESGGINRGLKQIAQEGARNHGLLNLSVIEFFRDIQISRPSLEEQEKIGDFLKTVTNKIDQVSNQIKQNQQFKKGLLQQMFV